MCLGEFLIDCSAKDGKNFKSLEFKELWRKTKYLKNRLTHVLWVDVDRFGRSGGISIFWFEKFRKIGVEVNFVNEWFDFSIPESLPRFYSRLGDAEAEDLRLSIRTTRGKAGLRSSGFYNDTLPKCWAFEELRREDGRKYAQAVEPYFNAYRIATLAFDTGISQAAAVRKAKEVTGYEIPSSTFSRFLLSPLPYQFMPIWDKYDIPHHARTMIDMVPCRNVPPMFKDLNMFYRIRERVKNEAPEGAGISREPFNPEFPLKYPCPSCGSPMRGYFANPKRKTPTPYYDCKKCGKETRLHRKKANALVAEMLNSFELKPEVREMLESGVKKALILSGKGSAQRQGSLTKKLKNVLTRIEHLDQNLHRYDPEIYSSTKKKLQMEKLQVEAEIDAISREKEAGIELRLKLVNFLENMGDWFVDQATGPQQARFLHTLFPEGYTIFPEGCRTWYINRIFESMATIPEGYKLKRAEYGQNNPQTARSGRPRAEGRTIKADIIALQDFFASLKNAA